MSASESKLKKILFVFNPNSGKAEIQPQLFELLPPPNQHRGLRKRPKSSVKAQGTMISSRPPAGTAP